MRVVNVLAFACAFFVACSCDGRDYSGKTFFKSQPLNLPTGGSFFDDAPVEHLVDNELFKDIKFDASVVYRMSRAEEKLGSYFAPDASKNTVSVGALASEYDLFNQNIIYYDVTSGFQAPLVRGTFALRPREIVRGLKLSARKWLGKFYCDVAVTCAHAEHDWQMDIKDAVIDPVTGLHAISFFQGGVKTVNQNPLQHAMLSDVIPSNGYEVFNCVLTAGSDAQLTHGGRVGLFGEVIIPAASYKFHEELFSPVVGNVGHMGIGVGARSIVTLAHSKKLSVGCFSVARATKFFHKDEKRVPGVLFDTQVGKASTPWGHYVLAKKTTASLYDPAVNLVDAQTLGVLPGAEGSFELGMFFEASSGMVSVGYRSWFRGDEDILLRNQQSSSIRYDRVLADGDYGLAPDLETCRVPAVITHTASVEGILYFARGAGCLRGQVGYEWVSGNAALHNVVASCGVTVSF